MSGNYVIDSLSSAVRGGVDVLARDIVEIEKLQTSQSGVRNFAISAYRKSGIVIAKHLMNIGHNYESRFPNLAVWCGGRNRHLINVSELFDSDKHVGKNVVDKLGTFIINPIDSLFNFGRALPFIGTSIVVRSINDQSIAIDSHAVLYDLRANIFYTSTIGNGAYVNDIKIKVSNTRNIDDMLVVMHGFEDAVRFSNKISNKQLLKIRNASMYFALTININNTNLALADLATGRVDAVIDLDIKDDLSIISGLLIAKEAGATITTIDGTSAAMDDIIASGSLLASNGFAHNAIIDTFFDV